MSSILKAVIERMVTADSFQKQRFEFGDYVRGIAEGVYSRVVTGVYVHPVIDPGQDAVVIMTDSGPIPVPRLSVKHLPGEPPANLLATAKKYMDKELRRNRKLKEKVQKAEQWKREQDWDSLKDRLMEIATHLGKFQPAKVRNYKFLKKSLINAYSSVERHEKIKGWGDWDTYIEYLDTEVKRCTK